MKRMNDKSREFQELKTQTKRHGNETGEFSVIKKAEEI